MLNCALLKSLDIHWEMDLLAVTSQKTAWYGKSTRVIPLFQELRGFLDDAFAMASEGETWVVPMLGGNPDKNLGTTFRKLVKRAGVEPWPKPFQNCRSSRQTELEQTFPTYVVCSWLGNSPTVAHKHYLTVTDEHFESASKIGDSLGMQPPVSSRTEAQKKTHTFQHVRENASFSEVVGMLENARVAAEGLELRLQTAQKRTPVFKGEAKPEAEFVDGSPAVTALAIWLSQILSDEQLTELALQLHKVKK